LDKADSDLDEDDLDTEDFITEEDNEMNFNLKKGNEKRKVSSNKSNKIKKIGSKSSNNLIDVFALYGNMDQHKRAEILSKYCQSDSGVLICTVCSFTFLTLPHLYSVF
jgi:superfamily II DNA/RNA helicase